MSPPPSCVWLLACVVGQKAVGGAARFGQVVIDQGEVIGGQGHRPGGLPGCGSGEPGQRFGAVERVMVDRSDAVREARSPLGPMLLPVNVITVNAGTVLVSLTPRMRSE